jgi:hypothetical protein
VDVPRWLQEVDVSGVTLVFAAVVLTRFLLPLLIPRYPLPAIIACLIVDAVDQTVFQVFGYDPPGYQGYDKAMDVYYLAVAYMATMRNWQNVAAFAVGRFLYFYRLVGVVAFELAQLRALLLVFPNTFEYFFIAYEGVRSRWNPLRWGLRAWLLVAAVIWVLVKLPQEYWIHVAKLDVTDTLRDYGWAAPLMAVLVLTALAALWYGVVPRLGRPDWDLRMAADPPPASMDTALEQASWRAAHLRVMSTVTLEKVVLVGLLSVIFAQTLPGVRATNAQLFLGMSVFVVVNAALVLVLSRRNVTTESLVASFAFRMVVNVGLVVLADWLLGRERGDLDLGNAVFFVFLLSLLTTMFDRYQPLQAWRRSDEAAGGGR